MKPLKPLKPLKSAHTANTKFGMGDFYGTGVKAPLAKVKESMGSAPVSKAGLKKPPRSLA